MSNAPLHAAVIGIAIFSCMLGFTIGVRYIYIEESLYECTFKNGLGNFIVTEKELDKSNSMIMVSKDNRTFMFERNKLSMCIEKVS